MFSSLQLKPLCGCLRLSRPLSFIKEPWALTSSSGSHLLFLFSSSACPFIFNSPPEDCSTGEEDLSLSTLSFSFLRSGVLERERDSEASFALLDQRRSSLRLLLLLLRGGGSDGGLKLRLLRDAPPTGLCRLAYLRGGDLERVRDLDEEAIRDTARRRRGGVRSLYLWSFPRDSRGRGGVLEGDRNRRLLRGERERETDALRLGVGERGDL